MLKKSLVIVNQYVTLNSYLKFAQTAFFFIKCSILLAETVDAIDLKSISFRVLVQAQQRIMFYTAKQKKMQHQKKIKKSKKIVLGGKKKLNSEHTASLYKQLFR
jgi:hypothetical protein